MHIDDGICRYMLASICKDKSRVLNTRLIRVILNRQESTIKKGTFPGSMEAVAGEKKHLVCGKGNIN